MTDTQLYLAIGVPSLLALLNLGIMLTLFTDLSRRLSALGERMTNFDERINSRIDALTGAVNDLYKRLTRVEIKLGIQP